LLVPYFFSAGELWDPRLQGSEYQGLMSSAHLYKLWGVDFGIGHPFAAVLLYWDKEADVVYVMAEVKISGGSAADHASRLRSIAPGVPVAWPHDGNQRDKGSGKVLADIYRQEGLLMLQSHSTFVQGGYDFEAGIMMQLGLMRQGKLKVSERCRDWALEFGTYRRGDNGLVIKENDDLMSATRVGLMSIRHARQGGVGTLRFDERTGKLVPSNIKRIPPQRVQDSIWTTGLDADGEEFGS